MKLSPHRKSHKMPHILELGLHFLNGLKQKVNFPCALFSWCLTPVEQNYDIGNWELMAMKIALEEWRHWLKEAEQPFLIWTDHKKNLSI